jgi:hypothetical protein
VPHYADCESTSGHGAIREVRSPMRERASVPRRLETEAFRPAPGHADGWRRHVGPRITPISRNSQLRCRLPRRGEFRPRPPDTQLNDLIRPPQNAPGRGHAPGLLDRWWQVWACPDHRDGRTGVGVGEAASESLGRVCMVSVACMIFAWSSIDPRNLTSLVSHLMP